MQSTDTLVNRQSPVPSSTDVTAPMHSHHVGLSAALLWYAGGQLLDAVGVCAQEMGDPQLALFLGRIMESPEQPLVSQIVHKELLPGEIKPSTEMDIITAGSITES